MKYLYTAIFLLYLSQGSVAAQEKGGFFDKIKGTFSSEIKIGTHTFKDGSVYTGEMKGRKPNGKGKTVFKNGDVYEGEYVKGKREGYGEWTKLDSAEVVHGSFSMKGKIDSVQMTTLYMDDESVMPVVLESGKIVITISNTDLKAVGTPLNTALYDFIAKKNAMEESIGELERKETRMVMDGADLEEVHEQLLAEGDSLMKAMNQYVKTFISDNYENVLGPNVFIMLCSSLPYPIMTPQIDDIIKDAPYSFKSNKMVREFLTKAKENMQLIEEHQRMQQNVGPKK